MHVSKYPIKSTRLKDMAESIWHLTSASNENIDNELLPVINTDLIINVSAPIFYRFPKEAEVRAPIAHIRNVKRRVQIIRQQGTINVWGVSLYPWGAYTLLQSDMTTLEGCIIDLAECSTDFVDYITAKLSMTIDEIEAMHIIEKALEKWLDVDLDTKEVALLKDFADNLHSQNISDFCAVREMSIKKLERLVKRYVGITPKQLQQIGRFQKISNQIIYSPSTMTFVDLAYTYNYYDQTHFIKDFKTYSDVAPSNFLNKHNSIKEKIK